MDSVRMPVDQLNPEENALVRAVRHNHKRGGCPPVDSAASGVLARAGSSSLRLLRGLRCGFALP